MISLSLSLPFSSLLFQMECFVAVRFFGSRCIKHGTGTRMSSSSSSTLRVALLCVFVVPKILLFPSLHFWKKKDECGSWRGGAGAVRGGRCFGVAFYNNNNNVRYERGRLVAVVFSYAEWEERIVWLLFQHGICTIRDKSRGGEWMQERDGEKKERKTSH